MAVPTQEKCPGCGADLIAWAYCAADGDTLFHGAYDVIEGHGELQKRAALICRFCDRTDAWPGMGTYGRKKD